MDQQTILLTGGTGSFGTACTRTLLERGDRVIVYSRDDVKQWEMRKAFAAAAAADQLRFFVGDVRDLARLRRAFEARPNVVIHAAALKQVDTCERNPFEALKTNVGGAANVIEAALDCEVPRVIALSTDKAVAAVNTYGKTKALAESLFVRANSYAGTRPTRFSVVRYGNVIGSRGSVVPLFLEQRETGVLLITDHRMTRFWMPLETAVAFVLDVARLMQGGEIFVPKIPAARLTDVAAAIAPKARCIEVGLRPGEKLHELLLSADEAPQTLDAHTHYQVMPVDPSWRLVPLTYSRAVPDGFQYSSADNLQPVTLREEPCASR